MKERSLKYRFLWTWDHSMDWVPLAEGIQEWGYSNPYCKKAENFVQDYQRLIDFFSPLGFSGVIIYGLLRDRHGGIDAAQEICRYAREKGMPVVAGIGVNAYGGMYWEGKHEFNLSHWLDRHPELEAVGQRFPRHPYLRMACPSKKENRQWMRDAVRWLCETVDIGGLNFETGDYGLCQCDECVRRSSRTADWSTRDIAELLPPLIEEAEKARPGILSICECYFDNVLDTDAFTPLQSLPGNAILQFTINRSYWPRFQKEMDLGKVAQLPSQRKIIRTHMGSQWNEDRHRFVARDFSELVKKVAEIGMEGLTIFSEVSYLKTVHEINYLSIASFFDNPELEWNEFIRRKLAPLLGGKEPALKYIELLEKDKVTRADIETAKSILDKRKEPAYRRWLWLVDLLYQRIEEG